MNSFRTILILIAVLLNSVPVGASLSDTADIVTPDPAIAVAPVAQASSGALTSPAASLSPVVTVQGASPDQLARVNEALLRFRAEELRLPDMVVEFVIDNPDACNGAMGLFRHGSAPLQLTICSNAKFVVTHEFAHAWMAVHLDDDDRQDYTDARGLDTWNSRDFEWKDRAVEDAAFALHQNLMLIGYGQDSPASRDRIVAYELLTGQRSPLRPSYDLVEGPRVDPRN